MGNQTRNKFGMQEATEKLEPRCSHILIPMFVLKLNVLERQTHE